MPTPNMSLTQSDVGSTPGPTWASNVESNWTAVDDHNHASGSGVQITPAGININADVEFNENQPKELKGVVLSNTTASSDNSAVYQSGGDLYWRNAGGVAVQGTSGGTVKTTGGSIDGMSGTDAEAAYGSGIFTWQFDSTKTPFAGAKMSHADINLYKYDASSGSNAYVQMKYTGTSEGSNILTVPDETATLLTTSTSYAGAISIANTTGTITIDAEGDLVLDTNSGIIYIKDGGTAIGAIKNSSSDLVFENEVDAKDIIFKQYDGSEIVRMADDRRLYFWDKGGEYIYGDGSNLTLVAGTNIVLGSGWTAASQTCANLGTVTTCDINGGAIDGITLGTNSAVTEAQVDNININGNTISSTDSNGDINLDCNGTGDIECAADVKTSTTKKVYSKGNCFQTSFHASLALGY